MFLESVPSSEQDLDREDLFAFRCGPDLPCFGRCCRNKDLPLTPYDVLRLKKALALHSDVFLERYALYRLDPVSGFPVLSLRMEEDAGRTCPFLKEGGCSVYQDRPTACRLFPLGRASRPSPDGLSCEVRFSRVSLPYCVGSQEGRSWTVGAWVKDQGLSPYLDFNDRMLRLLFHPDAPRRAPLHDSRIQRVLVACYNLDLFREFLVAATVFERFHVPEEDRRAILGNDERLLEFGHGYLEKTLFPRPADSCRGGRWAGRE